MTADPTNLHAVLKRDLPNKPVLDRRRGNYEYQAVASFSGGDYRGERLFVFQSNRKLTGDEVIARVQAAAAALDDFNSFSGRNQGAIAPNAVPDVYIVAASFFDPTRGGTQ